jgi:Spy/CpxP family protein refolding chaperone
MSTRKKVLIVVAAVVALGATVVAQAPRFHHRARMHAFIARQLDLTEAQKAEAKEIFKEARESAKPLVAQLREGHKAMAEAIKAGTSELELEQLASEQGTLVGKVAGIYAKAFSKFYASLTPEQKQKADKLHEQFKEFRGLRFSRLNHF